MAIQVRRIPGFVHIQLLRRDLSDECEFATIMRFENLDAAVAFAGEDYAAAVVPPTARALLSRFDERSQHDMIKAERGAGEIAQG